MFIRCLCVCVCMKQINFMFILESYSKDTRIPHHVFASTPKSEKIQNLYTVVPNISYKEYSYCTQDVFGPPKCSILKFH